MKILRGIRRTLGRFFRRLGAGFGLSPSRVREQFPPEEFAQQHFPPDEFVADEREERK